MYLSCRASKSPFLHEQVNILSPENQAISANPLLLVTKRTIFLELMSFVKCVSELKISEANQVIANSNNS